MPHNLDNPDDDQESFYQAIEYQSFRASAKALLKPCKHATPKELGTSLNGK